jgi:hypothetical protein
LSTTAISELATQDAGDVTRALTYRDVALHYSCDCVWMLKKTVSFEDTFSAMEHDYNVSFSLFSFSLITNLLLFLQT